MNKIILIALLTIFIKSCQNSEISYDYPIDNQKQIIKNQGKYQTIEIGKDFEQ